LKRKGGGKRCYVRNCLILRNTHTHIPLICKKVAYLKNAGKCLFTNTCKWGLDDRSSIPRKDRNFFIFTTASKPALVPTQPPIQWIPAALSLGLRLPGLETDNSSPSSAEVTNAWNYTSTSPYVFMVWYLIKQGTHLHGVLLD